MRRVGIGSVTVRVGVTAVLLGTAGCSSVPDEVNPAEWYRSASSWISGDQGQQSHPPSALAEPTPAERADTFPNLASVPERPTPTADPASRRDAIASLQRQGAEARSEAGTLGARAAEEIGRRELPMAQEPSAQETPAQEPSARLPEPQRGGATPADRPATGLAMPPAAAAPSLAPPITTPATMPAGPTAAPPATATATATATDLAPAMPAPPIPAPELSAPTPSAPTDTGGTLVRSFTPGAAVAPRPPVMPPQPLSVRASG